MATPDPQRLIEPCDMKIEWWAEHPDDGKPRLLIDGKPVADSTTEVVLKDKSNEPPRVFIDGEQVLGRRVMLYRNGSDRPSWVVAPVWEEEAP